MIYIFTDFIFILILCCKQKIPRIHLMCDLYENKEFRIFFLSNTNFLFGMAMSALLMGMELVSDIYHPNLYFEKINDF